MASASLRCISRASMPSASKTRRPVISGAASLRAEIHRLVLQLMNVVHVGTHQDVHFLVEQLGDIGDLVDEIGAELAGLGIVLEDVGLGDAHVDAAQEQHVLDVLLRPLAHHGQDAQRRAVIEHVGDVLHDGEIRAAGAAGHDRHHVLVDARAEALARLSGDGVVRLGGVLGARRRDGGAGDQAESHSEGNTHDQFPHFERATLVNASAPHASARMRGGSGRSQFDWWLPGMRAADRALRQFPRSCCSPCSEDGT